MLLFFSVGKHKGYQLRCPIGSTKEQFLKTQRFTTGLLSWVLKYRLEPVDSLTPERVYQRRWALTLLDRVLGRLEREYADAGRSELFSRLKAALTGDLGSSPYRQIAEELSTTEGAVKVAVHRLRRRYRLLLKEEIAQTVTTAEEIEDELQQLFDAVRSETKV